MFDQLSSVSLDFAANIKRAMRDVFQAEITSVMPWGPLKALIHHTIWRTGRKWVSAAHGAYDVAHLLFAALMQSVWSKRRRGALRVPVDARILWSALVSDAIPDETTILISAIYSSVTIFRRSSSTLPSI